MQLKQNQSLHFLMLSLSTLPFGNKNKNLHLYFWLHFPLPNSQASLFWAHTVLAVKKNNFEKHTFLLKF